MSAQLTLYFDGHCPICIKHADFLRSADRHQKLAFVDIAAADFDPASIDADMDALNRALHGLRADGTMLTGVDAICAAFALVGRGWMTLPLRLPVLRSLAVPGYRSLARNRQRVSRLLGLRPAACPDGFCRSTLW